MRKGIFVWKLSQSERRRLEKLARKSRHGEIVRKAAALLGSFQGRSAKEIALALGVDASSVRRWIRAFNRQGEASLILKPRSGRPPKIGAKERALLERALKDTPGDWGFPGTVWTLRALQALLRKRRKVFVGEAALSLALRRWGYRHKRPKLCLKHKQDQGEVRRAQRMKRAVKKKFSPVGGAPWSFSMKRNFT